MIHSRPCRPMAGCGLVMMIIRGCPFITLYKFRVLRDPSTLCNIVINWDAHSLWLVYFWMGWLLQENRREVLMCLWKKTLAEAQQTFISSQGKASKDIHFTQALTPPPYSQLFVNFFGVWKKTGALWSKHTVLSPFLVGQNFYICLRSGPVGYTMEPTLSKASLVLTTKNPKVGFLPGQILFAGSCPWKPTIAWTKEF